MTAKNASMEVSARAIEWLRAEVLTDTDLSTHAQGGCFSDPRWAAECEIVQSLAVEFAKVASEAVAGESKHDARRCHLNYLLHYRGIPEDAICPSCGGSGIRCYGSTSTWRGGIGGAAMTNGVCDRCWGSGNTTRPGENLRVLWSRVRTAETAHRGKCKLADEVARAEREKCARQLEGFATKAGDDCASALRSLRTGSPS